MAKLYKQIEEACANFKMYARLQSLEEGQTAGLDEKTILKNSIAINEAVDYVKSKLISSQGYMEEATAAIHNIVRDQIMHELNEETDFVNNVSAVKDDLVAGGKFIGDKITSGGQFIGDTAKNILNANENAKALEAQIEANNQLKYGAIPGAAVAGLGAGLFANRVRRRR